MEGSAIRPPHRRPSAASRATFPCVATKRCKGRRRCLVRGESPSSHSWAFGSVIFELSLARLWVGERGGACGCWLRGPVWAVRVTRTSAGQGSRCPRPPIGWPGQPQAVAIGTCERGDAIVLRRRDPSSAS